jgi:hypothetical protein
MTMWKSEHEGNETGQIVGEKRKKNGSECIWKNEISIES